MCAKHRELTEKYKAFRLQPDSLYLSRLIQTFFNKFTKKGKKALARRHLFTALTQFRFTLRHPQMYYALLRIFHRLRIQFLLASKRKGRNLISVPVPVRRNKRDVLNIQTLYKAVTSRRERVAPRRNKFYKAFYSYATTYRYSYTTFKLSINGYFWAPC